MTTLRQSLEQVQADLTTCHKEASGLKVGGSAAALLGLMLHSKHPALQHPTTPDC